MTLFPLGDAAVLIAVGESVDDATAARVRAVVAAIERERLAGVSDVVGSFASVAVFYDPVGAGEFGELMRKLERLATDAAMMASEGEERWVEVPVRYGGEFGPDLGVVALHAALTEEAVIAAHAGAEYRVHAIGFAPGFPYLGGLPPALAAPRRATPRTQVPAGAVGIGGTQTGVYPLATPGGWNLIGRTPLRLFDPGRSEAALLRAGDRVRFRVIDAGEFARIAANEANAMDVAKRRRGREEGEGKGLTERSRAGDIEVIRAGALTTVQDRGRPGHRAAGVPLTGGADAMALRVANLLVGNPEEAAVLEFTLIGPELRFARATVIAVSGGDFGVPRWTPLRVAAGETLRLGQAKAGCRGYLAVAGGIDVPRVLGSRSTYLRGALGGWEGRALRDGDVLPAGLPERAFRNHWRIDERILPEYGPAPIVRVVRGAQAEEFAADWMEREFRVTPQSDRMGVRLYRATPVTRRAAGDLTSSPVVPGTIQVPPDGQPIVLLADAQTIGGYPQIGHVISVDLPLVAQLRPGDAVRFREVSLEEAHELWREREQALGWLREGIALKLA